MRKKTKPQAAGYRPQGLVFVISGPSGSGKTTLAGRLFKSRILKGVLARSVSLTTRPRRAGEKDKKDYFFVSEGEFRRLRQAKKILEWTRYLGYYYATPRDFVEENLKKSKSMVLCLDLKGALRVKSLYPRASRTVFIMPPSLEALRARITGRGRETREDEIRQRLKAAEAEIKARDKYDYCIENNKLPLAVRQARDFILREIQAAGRALKDTPRLSDARVYPRG